MVVPMLLKALAIVVDHHGGTLSIIVNNFCTRVLLNNVNIIVRRLDRLLAALFFNRRVIDFRLLRIPSPRGPTSGTLNCIGRT